MHDVPRTADEALLWHAAHGFTHLPGSDIERIREFDAEFATGFQALAGVEKGVSVFGSARTTPDDPDYGLARDVATHLGHSGFAVITGGGGGIMEAANRGAKDVTPPPSWCSRVGSERSMSCLRR